MRSVHFVVLAAILSLQLTACASGSSIVTGTTRPATTPDLVRVYSDPPKQFEVIGLVRAESNTGWTSQQDMNSAVAELQRRAALLGANGILIEKTGTRFDIAAEQVTMVEGRAIFVTEP
jgi:hypothetical protein